MSLDLIRRVAPDVESSIIDVGGGASTLVDGLAQAGYRRVTVLDIADSALAIAQQRIGERAQEVTWVQSDVLNTSLPSASFDVWHDRAVFHFLTDPSERQSYVQQVRNAVRPGGHVIVASFAPNGPRRCSGLDVMRYSPTTMHDEFGPGFLLLDSVGEEHHTPSGATQAFVYCLCRVPPAAHSSSQV
ncbi:MAG: SAM-dependent methyltransferase [Gemmatimonadetes bacterium]|nr:SAM-dependent methyltransferase [Gemmatimonadota bacterium]